MIRALLVSVVVALLMYGAGFLYLSNGTRDTAWLNDQIVQQASGDAEEDPTEMAPDASGDPYRIYQDAVVESGNKTLIAAMLVSLVVSIAVLAMLLLRGDKAGGPLWHTRAQVTFSIGLAVTLLGTVALAFVGPGLFPGLLHLSERSYVMFGAVVTALSVLGYWLSAAIGLPSALRGAVWLAWILGVARGARK